MKVSIAEPNLSNGLEQFTATVATETRGILQELFCDKPASFDVPKPLSKDELTCIKQAVYGRADKHMQRATGLLLPPDENLSTAELTDTARIEWMLRALASAGFAAYMNADTDDYNPVLHSHSLEYANSWLKAFLFKNNLPLPSSSDAAQTVAVGIACAPRGTCGYTDDMYVRMSRPLVDGYTPPFRGLLLQTPTLSEGLHRLVSTNTEDVLTSLRAGMGAPTKSAVGTRSFLRGVVYTEAEVAMFAGYVTLGDFYKLNYRRIPLARAAKEITGSDTAAQKAADVRNVTSYDIVLHPNDRPFGYEYIRMRGENNSLQSCMTQPAYAYSSPYGVHPCDVYSTAHYGQGDNGLVLVEAVQAGVPVGRGIMNVHSKTIVRWYGEHKAAVMLRNMYGIHIDSDAMDGVRLALIQAGDLIAAPYLDGCQAVELCDGVLTVGSYGSIEMDDTSGCTALDEEDTYCCTISGADYPESELRYQSSTETYYHPDNTDMECAEHCPVLDEWHNGYSGHYIRVDGEQTWVHDSVGPEELQDDDYTYMDDTIGYTRSLDDYVWDDVNEQYYSVSDYEYLIAEREQEESNESNQ
ncbi:hypothetical protein PP16_gp10 [Pectobacterium phage PP16]|uniref:Uncharacterized protein n=1 Tax=Pectobacterium phage PP16 TaxID=1873958 RepID=A0A1B1PEB5_9CAUD|nr:hypothetical protein PP16_gp10 [Pectobacterium phage PP16]ANT45309.1 hypothetical protein PP16_gp10 [Pectobacterium phage PP16]